MPGIPERSDVQRSGEWLSGAVSGKLDAFMETAQKSFGDINASLQSIAQRLDEGGRDMAVITSTLTRVEKRTDEHSDRISGLHRALNEQERDALVERTSETLRRQLEAEYEERLTALRKDAKGSAKADAKGGDGSSWLWQLIQKRVVSILVGGILAALGTAGGMAINAFFQAEAKIAAQQIAVPVAAPPAAAPPIHTP
jgi:hypothetical protein